MASDDDHPGLPGTIEAQHPLPPPLYLDPYPAYSDPEWLDKRRAEEKRQKLEEYPKGDEPERLVTPVPTKWDDCYSDLWLPRSLEDWKALLKIDVSAPEMDKRVGRPSSVTHQPKFDETVDFLRWLIEVNDC